MNKSGRRSGLWIYLIFIAMLVIGAYVLENTMNRTTEMSYTEYTESLEKGEVMLWQPPAW